MLPSQTGAVASLKVAISARIPLVADWRMTCGEGPGVLEGQNVCVDPVQASVLQSLSGLVGGLGEVRNDAAPRNPNSAAPCVIQIDDAITAADSGQNRESWRRRSSSVGRARNPAMSWQFGPGTIPVIWNLLCQTSQPILGNGFTLQI